jgi:hypothetical protein
MAAFTSASDSEGSPPFGGIAPFPLIALLTRWSSPSALWCDQTALSPIFGAPSTPAPWHATQRRARGGRGCGREQLRGIGDDLADRPDAILEARERARVLVGLRADRAGDEDDRERECAEEAQHREERDDENLVVLFGVHALLRKKAATV